MAYRNWHISFSTWFLPTPNRTEIMNGRIYSGSRENTTSLDRKRIIDVSKQCEIKDNFSWKSQGCFFIAIFIKRTSKEGSLGKSRSQRITNVSIPPLLRHFARKIQVLVGSYFIHCLLLTDANTQTHGYTYTYIYIYIYIYIHTCI